MRPDPAVPPSPTFPWFLLLLAAVLATAPAPARAQGGPAFGDSGWVAPSPAGAIDGEPTDPGPRVAPRDVEPVGETVLRTPFRAAFLPLRLLGMGLEALAGIVGESVIPGRTFGHQETQFTVGPTVSYAGSAGPGAGLRAVYVIDRAHAAQLSGGGTWSLYDTRKADLKFRWGAAEEPWGIVARTTYALRPNHRFYGIGNQTSEADKSIYLGETGLADVAWRFGTSERQVRLLGGWQSTSVRRGWNDSPGVLDVFTLPEVPGMLDATSVVSFGLGGDLALVDDLRDPSAGVHGRAEARQFHALSGGDFDFRRYHLEGRAYVPVFSARRVIALRAVHQSVDPIDDGAGVPFYHLPEAADEARFAGYAAHRFMDRHLALAHAEYRWLIWDRLWALGLAEVGEVASSLDRLRIADVHESYGGGLRFAFSESSVARLQVAKGSEGISAYVTFKEDF
jgi:hypothetical protein